MVSSRKILLVSSTAGAAHALAPGVLNKPWLSRQTTVGPARPRSMIQRGPHHDGYRDIHLSYRRFEAPPGASSSPEATILDNATTTASPIPLDFDQTDKLDALEYITQHVEDISSQHVEDIIGEGRLLDQNDGTEGVLLIENELELDDEQPLSPSTKTTKSETRQMINEIAVIALRSLWWMLLVPIMSIIDTADTACVGRVAPFTSVMCSLAPLPTIFEVARKKSVGSMPILPYSSMAANGFVWSLYGWLVDSPAVQYANMMGALLGAYYFKEFKKYTPQGSSSLPGTVKQHMLVVTWMVFLNGFIISNFPRKTAAGIVGKEGILMFIILFASPLAAVKEVIATKSAASIPLPFTIASTINCSLWSVTGLLLMKDFNIFFPSVMGLMCALAQLFLKGIYGGRREKRLEENVVAIAA